MLADPFLAGWDGAADTELDSADKLTGTAISDLDLPPWATATATNLL